jgi:hypothetical protein
MKSWQPHQRLLLFLLLALALTSAISPILTLGADWFMTQSPALVPQRMPFHRTLQSRVYDFRHRFVLIFPPRVNYHRGKKVISRRPQ